MSDFTDPFSVGRSSVYGGREERKKGGVLGLEGEKVEIRVDVASRVVYRRCVQMLEHMRSRVEVLDSSMSDAERLRGLSICGGLRYVVVLLGKMGVEGGVEDGGMTEEELREFYREAMYGIDKG